MKTWRLLLVMIVVGSLPLSVHAADWPQWRGPERNGISKETGLLKEWPKAGPQLVWQAKNLGDGYSTPAVVGDHLYLLSSKGMSDESVISVGTKDGKPAWSTRLGKVGPNQGPQYPGARSTPTINGDALFALGSNGDLACVEIAGGSIRWLKSLRSDFGGKPGQWAYSESPLIDGDVLVCTPGGEEATIVALNKKNGDVIWKSAIPGEQPAYASAIVVDVGGIKQYVQFLKKGLVGVDAKSGKLLWSYNKTAQGSPANIPSPVADGPYIYSASGRGGGGLIKLDVSNDAVTAKQVYYSNRLPTSIGGVVDIGGYLYGTGSQGLECVEFATGTVKWQDRSIGAGAVCNADGCLYLHGESGDVALVETTPEAYREKGRFTPPGRPAAKNRREKAWAYPVVADGRLYIHEQGTLWSYDVRAQLAAK